MLQKMERLFISPKIRIFALFAGVLFASPAFAQIIPSIPYNLTNGSLADATQVMGNFNTIVTDTNANAATAGANTNITSLSGLTTPLAPTYGGTVVYTGGTTTGTANAQTLASVIPSSFTLTAGNIVTGIAGYTNAGTMTLSVNGTTAKQVDVILAAGLAAAPAGAIIVGGQYAFLYDGTVWQVLNPTTGNFTLTGDVTSVGNVTTVAKIAGTAVSGTTGTTNSVFSASPTFTGTPVAPTAAANTSTTQLATTAFANPASSLVASGYVKLPSGLIQEWGITGNVTAMGSVTVSLPLTFPTAIYNVQITQNGQTNNAQTASYVDTVSTSSFILYNRGVTGDVPFYWSAIGK